VEVPVSVHDYLIEQGNVDWSTALAGWSWLLPREFTLWLVNRFCDLFIVDKHEAIHMLDVGSGTLTRVAGSRDEFCCLIDEDNNANNWLMMPLVDQLVAADMLLQPGQCYGFKVPPVLGGQYQVGNCGVLPIADYLGAYGSIHDRLRGLPDGAQVVLKVVDNPS
jgi:hypothetical protein